MHLLFALAAEKKEARVRGVRVHLGAVDLDQVRIHGDEQNVRIHTRVLHEHLTEHGRLRHGAHKHVGRRGTVERHGVQAMGESVVALVRGGVHAGQVRRMRNCLSGQHELGVVAGLASRELVLHALAELGVAHVAVATGSVMLGLLGLALRLMLVLLLGLLLVLWRALALDLHLALLQIWLLGSLARLGFALSLASRWACHRPAAALHSARLVSGAVRLPGNVCPGLGLPATSDRGRRRGFVLPLRPAARASTTPAGPSAACAPSAASTAATAALATGSSARAPAVLLPRVGTAPRFLLAVLRRVLTLPRGLLMLRLLGLHARRGGCWRSLLIRAFHRGRPRGSCRCVAHGTYSGPARDRCARDVRGRPAGAFPSQPGGVFSAAQSPACPVQLLLPCAVRR